MVVYDRGDLVTVGPGRSGGRACRCKREDGTAVLEFALILPFLCALIFLFLDFGKAMSYWLNATQVANEGARLAAVNAPGVSNIQTYLKAELDPELRNGSLNVGPHAPATITVCYPDGGKTDVGEPVRVTITSAYRPTLFALIGPLATVTNFATIPIKSSATMRLEHDANNPALAGGACT